jgi:beta-lactamase class A
LAAELDVPKAGGFRYAACLGARARRAMGPRADHRRCGKQLFRGGHNATLQGRGEAPFGFPPRRRIGEAAKYLNARTGRKAFAVVSSEGRVYGQNIHRTFVSASVVKAMLLVAYLRMVAADHRDLTSSDRSILDPMIEVSDNSAATQAWEIVGNERLLRLASAAGMSDFSIVADWASAQISAADQARFFFAMHRVLPWRFRGYADHLLSHIVDYESWGIPAVARPAGWAVYFKGGWRGTDLGQLVHQAARLRGHDKRIAIAVMTDGDPSMDYGIETIEGVTAHLVR